VFHRKSVCFAECVKDVIEEVVIGGRRKCKCECSRVSAVRCPVCRRTQRNGSLWKRIHF